METLLCPDLATGGICDLVHGSLLDLELNIGTTGLGKEMMALGGRSVLVPAVLTGKLVQRCVCSEGPATICKPVLLTSALP